MPFWELENGKFEYWPCHYLPPTTQPSKESPPEELSCHPRTVPAIDPPTELNENVADP